MFLQYFMISFILVFMIYWSIEFLRMVFHKEKEISNFGKCPVENTPDFKECKHCEKCPIKLAFIEAMKDKK